MTEEEKSKSSFLDQENANKLKEKLVRLFNRTTDSINKIEIIHDEDVVDVHYYVNVYFNKINSRTLQAMDIIMDEFVTAPVVSVRNEYIRLF